MREPNILWEGPACYAVREPSGEYSIRVCSSNYVQHVEIRRHLASEGDRVETTCRRLNAYPQKTRASFGML